MRNHFDSHAAKTCIDVYDAKLHKAKNVYTHPGGFSIIGATINEDKTLLAFVTENTPEGKLTYFRYIFYIYLVSIGTGDPVYSTWLVELHASGVLHQLEKDSFKPQNLHFLQSLQDNNSSYLICVFKKGGSLGA